MGATPSSSQRLRTWGVAARIHTLPAGMSPVIVGIALALADDVYAFWPALAALVGAILIQIGTNFVNDYADAIRGVDSPEGVGFTRVTANGLLEPEVVKRAAIGTFGLAILVGTYLVYIGGLPIVIIGLSSILFGYAYTGGPRPYGYRGLGDVFVFLYFGLVAVVGTYYVQAVTIFADPIVLWVPAGSITSDAVMGGIAMGSLATAILVINNLRDIDEDQAAGKRTLAVIIGVRWTRFEFLCLYALAYLSPLWFILGDHRPVALVYLSVPLAAWVTHSVMRTRAEAPLNTALRDAALLTLAYSILFTIGVVL